MIITNIGGGGGIRLSSIAITTPPTKTTYNALETFNTAGMVITATYSNSATKIVTDYTYNTDPLPYGTSSITFTYVESGITKTATQAITVNKNSLTVPSQYGTLTYNGNTQTVSWSNYDSTKMTKSGLESAINAGSNVVTFTLLDTTNYQWSDGTTTAKEVSWRIDKLSLTIPTCSGSYTYDGNTKTASISNFNSTWENQSGTTSSVNVGSWTITWSLKDTSNTQWTDGTTGNKTGSWAINKASGYITLNSTAAGSCAWNSSGTRTISSSHGGTITVSSSNTTTCTVSLSGTTITITGANYNSGTASTITVTCAATTNYTAASATFSWTCTRTAGSITLSKSSMTISGAAGTTGTFTVSARTGSGTLSVSSASTGYVTASISGTTITCTSVASGSSVVTVTQAAAGNYNATSATCTVTATVIVYKRVGGRIFYDAGSNGNTYTFYDSSYNVLSTQTVAGLADAYYYTVSGSSSTARWYVYDNTTHTYSGVTFTNGLSSGSIYWGYYGTSTGATTNSIGSGKTNTTTVLNKGVPTDYTPNIWGYIKNCRDNALNGCSDWFIASNAEQDQLRSSGLVTWYSNYDIWSSVESSASYAYRWYCYRSVWGDRSKDYNFCCFAARAF